MANFELDLLGCMFYGYTEPLSYHYYLFFERRGIGCAYFIDIEEVYKPGSGTEITGVYLRCSEKDRKILRPRGHPRQRLALNFRKYGC
jgi:hypothetical protein